MVSSAESDACRSGRFDLRRNDASSATTACSTVPLPPASGDVSPLSMEAVARAAKVLTAVTRVISLRSRSRIMASVLASSDEHASP
eukprot:227553-Pleurochrysis_carterae.AAC.1